MITTEEMVKWSFIGVIGDIGFIEFIVDEGTASTVLRSIVDQKEIN